MIFGSLFSGIEAASCAWLPLGWRCAWTAEIDPFACAVLRHHYPTVPNLGDVNRIDPNAVEPVDLVVFGSPCQSFSVAGKRLGLDDPRGNMALVGLRLIGRIRPRWVVWENVPGVLSSDNGRDFGAFLGLLGELGYGFAYRVLDAQHAGVPQRRRRVFVVGCLGDWRGAAAVLFEPESLRGDPPPRREAGQGTAPSLAPGTGGGSGHQYRQKGNEDALIAGTLAPGAHPGGFNGSLLAFGGNNTAGPIDVATACNAHGGPHGRLDFETETLIAQVAGTLDGHNGTGLGQLAQFGQLIAFSAKDHGADAGDTAPTLRAGGHTSSHANAGVMPAIAFQANAGRDFTADEDRSPPHAVMTLATRGRGDSHELEWRDDGIANAIFTPNGGRAGIGVGAVAFAQNTRDEKLDSQHYIAFFDQQNMALGGDVAGTLDQQHHGRARAVASGMSVRRLTPAECEKLQGFLPGYTDVPYRGKPAADGNRYRAIGNSMAVPVIAWLGRRIQLVADTITEQAHAAE